MFIWKTKIQI